MEDILNINEFDLKLVSLHNIDLNNPEKAIQRNIGIVDAKEYILSLTRKMLNYKNVREYTVKSLTTEVVSQISKLCTNFKTFELSALSSDNKSDINFNDIHNTIADRLLKKQIEAQKKYAHLTELKKGSLIQSLIENSDEYIFILALVEHHKFIDDVDLTYKAGMPDEDKIALKSAQFHINKDGNINKIFLSDTTMKISDYWCNEFLEVEETIDDITNTKRAYNHYEAILKNTLSIKSPSDHSNLKNALNVYFAHNKSFSHEECVDFLLNDYQPISEDINIEHLREKFSEYNTRKTFDNTFNIDISPIKSKLNNTRYTVNENIELKIKKPFEQMKNNIYSGKLPTGEKVLIINNVDAKTLKQFNFNNIDL